MKHTLFILLGFVLLVACSSATPAPASTPVQATAALKPTTAPVNNQALVSAVKTGDWSGTAENNFSIAFTIGDGGATIVKGIEVTYKAACGTNSANVTETVALTDKISFTAGQFTYKNENYEIVGRAVAADRIEGTLKAEGVKIGRLGQCGASGIVWTAAPK